MTRVDHPPTAPSIACGCGRFHARWWRISPQVPSCGLIRSVQHDGLIYTPRQWAAYQALLADYRPRADG